MTMMDGKCDVCDLHPPIGVASTIIPYSCAYCLPCAQRHAQPELVCIVLYDSCGGNMTKLYQGVLDAETYKDGSYITIREWFEKYGAKVYAERSGLEPPENDNVPT